MADVIYNAFKKNIANGTIDLDTDTIKVMLVTSAYTPDQDAHEFKSEVTNEISGTGYVAGGQALSNKAVSQDNINNKSIFDADDVTWTASTITARGAVLYKDTGNPATSPLICYMDFGSDRSSSNGDFTLQFNTAGILNFN